MRKITGIVLALVFAFSSVLAAVELDNKNLKGINYIRTRCQFNDVVFYRGYKSPLEKNAEEFITEDAGARLKKAGVPVTVESIRTIHAQMESLLKDGGLRIVEVRQDGDSSTIIPTVGIDVDTMAVPGSKRLQVVSVYLTVSRWVSTWVGTEDIQSRVIVWWQKKTLTVKPDELNKVVNSAVQGLIKEFLTRWEEANTPGPED